MGRIYPFDSVERNTIGSMAMGIRIPPARYKRPASISVWAFRSGKPPAISPPTTHKRKVIRHSPTDIRITTATFEKYSCAFVIGMISSSFIVSFLCSSKNSVVANIPSTIGRNRLDRFLKASV